MRLLMRDGSDRSASDHLHCGEMLQKCSVKALPVQAIIEGYKSYKDQTISEPFDQHINVVGMLLGFRSLYLSNCHSISAPCSICH